MPLQTSGEISLNDLQNEFGGTHPASMSEYRGKDCTDITGPISFSDFYGKDDFVTAASNLYTYSGNGQTKSYTFTVPCGVFTVHILCIGGGGSGGEAFWAGGGGGGGSLTYVNNVDVIPESTLSVYVGRGAPTSGSRSNGNSGGTSSVRKNGNTIAQANGGSGGNGGTSSRTHAPGSGGAAWSGSSAMSFAGTNASFASYQGGNGGWGNDDKVGGGGGAAGYAGRGGYGRSDIFELNNGDPQTNSGGGHGGQSFNSTRALDPAFANEDGFRGGGVGVFGKGSDGNGDGGGGSGGSDGGQVSGGEYGAGGSGLGIDTPGQDGDYSPGACSGAPGAVRIIWGTNKSFPNNAS